jgi:transcriptional regulator with XRE-family HTH domain
MAAEDRAPRVGAIFARRLREARDERVWTQQDLSDALDALGAPMDRTTIAKLEKQQREVRLDELIAIAAALDVAVLHLILPIEGDDAVRLAPSLETGVERARDWAGGRHPLNADNARFYYYQSPRDSELDAENRSHEHLQVMNRRHAAQDAAEG